MSDMSLHGVKVLDLSNHGAAPMAAMHLADFGADVIKVEHPEKGDEMRRWGNSKDGIGLFFKVANRNKRTITLDLQNDRGRDLAIRLAEQCDVVVENFRTGTLERWGLGYQQLSARNPSLIMLHVTGFGQTGPRADRPGFGSLTEAFAGSVYSNGYPDRRPLMQSFMFGDASAAIFGAFSIMVALHHRLNTGEGQEIDLGLYEPILTMLGPMVIDYDQLGIVQERTGAESPHVAPRGTFRTADGKWVAISGSTQATFERICRALDTPELATDPRFEQNSSRVENVSALFEELDEIVARFQRDDLLKRAEQHQATIVPVNSVADLFEDEQVRSRDNITTLADEELGQVRMQNVAAKLSRTPGRVRHAGPPKGKHNDDVYTDMLGLDADELADLKRDGVI